MRRSIPSPQAGTAQAPSPDNELDLEEIATVDVSSEDPSYPFEGALQGVSGKGWRAAKPGPQSIRLVFDAPQTIRRIRLEFREESSERAQEFALYSTDAHQTRREIVRQQWAFSPGGSTRETEDYTVNLADVRRLELEIDPGRHDKQQTASLQSISLA